MAKSVKLNVSLQYDFNLIGIVSSEPVFRLAWLINEALGIKLSERAKLKLFHPKTQSLQHFDYFTTEDSIEDMFELISNKCENGFLLEDQSKIDYVLKITEPLSDISTMQASLKSISGVNMVFAIDIAKLKSKSRLLFDMNE